MFKKLTSKQEKIFSLVAHSLLIIAVLAILIITAVNDGVIDLNINKSIGRSSSFYGILFAIIAEWPAYFMLPFLAVIFFYAIEKKDGVAKYMLVRALAFILLVFGIFIWLYASTKLTSLNHEVEINRNLGATFKEIYPSPIRIKLFLTLSLIIAMIVLGISKFIDRDIFKSLLNFAIFALIVFLISFILIRIVKYSFTRVRYRTILINGDESAFTPWWKINGWKTLSTDDTSFPSGHTNAATYIFVYLLMFDIFDKLKKYKLSTCILAVVFVILSAISRIVNNAHYLSDVTVGGALTYLVIYIAKKIYFRKNRSLELASVYDLNRLKPEAL